MLQESSTTCQMTSRTPGDGIQEFLNLISSSDLLQKYNDILDVIKGPISVAKEKLNTIDSAEDVTRFLPNLPQDYCHDLRKSILRDCQMEVELAQNILEEIEETISTLQSCVDTVGQRILEGIKTKNPVILEDSELHECYEDCQNILTFFKLKSSILKHYLLRPPESQKQSNPFAHSPTFKHEEEKILVLLEKIKVSLQAGSDQKYI